MKKTEPIFASERGLPLVREKDQPVSEYFGENTFNFRVMQEKLPKDVYKKLIETIHEGKKLDLETAGAVAHAMKEWAISKGATHYCHWFQPMTGTTAEKHDSFIEFGSYGDVIERFSGQQLAQGEPDASSFPSGGIRSTFEARGYTIWDPSSPAFVLYGGMGAALFIPSVFLSYSGEALDKKTPLLRSIEALNRSSMNLLKLLGTESVKRVHATLGPEQEYFLIDQDYYYKRQDLVLTGRTLVGSGPAKGQQLEDQYLGSIKERILSFMHDAEEELYKLGIPAKTRHNEVAPSQFEIAPIYEEANLAVDHNQLVMETLRRVGKKHRFAALLHEKPFAGINGSGKHLNWSIADDQGNNFLTPGNTPHENIQFLLFLIATIRAVSIHGDLLRASVASAANDHRLGANEAPPAIISVFLGEQLTDILDNIEKGVVAQATDKAIIDLGISSLPELSKDSTDRNRTSPFAFTGAKFEFRAVGSSQSISFPATVLNTIVAESLDIVTNKVKSKGANINQAAIDVIREEMKEVKPVLFMGDNYSADWEKEAGKRGLPNRKTTHESLPDLITPKAFSLFEKYGVLSPVELKSRYLIRVERYCKEVEIEALALCDIVLAQIVPACVRYQGTLASSLDEAIEVLGEKFDMEGQKSLLRSLAQGINSCIARSEDLKKKLASASGIHDEQKKAEYFNAEIKPLMAAIRAEADRLETLADDGEWPLPKFWEMLFIS
jgi:glutamine synthetase